MDFLGGLASSGAGFGLNFASMLLSAEVQRKLRRTAYQDQMHSMKKAGLNPILAYGGGAGAGQGSVQMSAPEDPVSSANELAQGRTQRKLMAAQETTAMAQARKAEAEALTAEAIRDARVRDLEAGADLKGEQAQTQRETRPGQVELLGKEAHAAGQAAELSRFRRFGEYERAETERQLRAGRKRLVEAQGDQTSASAQEVRQKALALERSQPEYVVGEEGGRVVRGVRIGSEVGDDVLSVIPGTRTLRRIFSGRAREGRTSAKGVAGKPAKPYSRGRRVRPPGAVKVGDDWVDPKTGEVFE